ncbi:hypothetical protein C8R44DRAFT_880624 [Mycena epipterygia]|nr:hypothetical protein C8R44DRAFT_880624 [Mycena epipterygia]
MNARSLPTNERTSDLYQPTLDPMLKRHYCIDDSHCFEENAELIADQDVAEIGRQSEKGWEVVDIMGLGWTMRRKKSPRHEHARSVRDPHRQGAAVPAWTRLLHRADTPNHTRLDWAQHKMWESRLALKETYAFSLITSSQSHFAVATEPESTLRFSWLSSPPPPSSPYRTEAQTRLPYHRRLLHPNRPKNILHPPHLTSTPSSTIKALRLQRSALLHTEQREDGRGVRGGTPRARRVRDSACGVIGVFDVRLLFSWVIKSTGGVRARRLRTLKEGPLDRTKVDPPNLTPRSSTTTSSTGSSMAARDIILRQAILIVIYFLLRELVVVAQICTDLSTTRLYAPRSATTRACSFPGRFS